MTNERYTLEEFGLNFIVNDNGRNLTAKQTVDRLNELYDENEQLKQELQTVVSDASSYLLEILEIEKENEQLKSTINKYSQINKENRRLYTRYKSDR